MNKRKYTEEYYKHLYEKLSERAYLLEKMLKKKVEANKKSAKKLDPIDKEDEDVDNDGKPNTETDKYIKNRREKIKQAMMKKKKVVEEGTIVTNGEVFYGGFPKVVKEETDGVPPIDQWVRRKDPRRAGSMISLFPSQEYMNLHAQLDDAWDAKDWKKYKEISGQIESHPHNSAFEKHVQGMDIRASG